MYEDSSEEYVHDLLAQAIWPGQELGSAILGTRHTLAQMTAADLRQFYQQHYAAGNTVIAAAGSLEHGQLARQLESCLDLKVQPALEQPLHGNAPPAAPALLERSTEQLHLALGLPGLSLGDKRIYAWNLLNNILGAGMSSRLFQRLREEHALVYSAYSYTASFRQAGYSAIYLGLAPRNLPKAMQLIASELASLCQQHVSPAELLRAKAQVKGALVMGLESTVNHMSRIGRGLLMLDRVQPVEQVIAEIEAVNADELMLLAKDLLKREQLATAAIGNVDQVLSALSDFDWPANP